MSYSTEELDSIYEYSSFDYRTIKYYNPIKRGNGRNIYT